MHPTDQQGTMAISPNNAAFLLNMHMPIVSFTVVLKAFQSRNKNGVFFVNIVNQEYHENEHITELAKSMQALAYIDDIMEFS